jgi:hypothetical protein
MTTEYKWAIPQTDYETSNGFIFCAHWTCTATDGDYTASAYATVSWPEGTPAIPYDSLTEATVLGWVWESIDKEAIEASLSAQIALLKSPVKASGKPWSAE